MREQSPWMRCAACEGCRFWTGWVCMNEPTGFRDCEHYGTDFVETVVAIDHATGAARYVVLERGQTADDLSVKQQTTPLDATESQVSGWCNLMALIEGDES